MLIAQQRIPISQWRDPVKQGALVTHLADALHPSQGQSYRVTHTFTNATGRNVAADSPEALNAIVTVTIWKD